MVWYQWMHDLDCEDMSPAQQSYYNRYYRLVDNTTPETWAEILHRARREEMEAQRLRNRIKRYLRRARFIWFGLFKRKKWSPYISSQDGRR